MGHDDGAARRVAEKHRDIMRSGRLFRWFHGRMHPYLAALLATALVAPLLAETARSEAPPERTAIEASNSDALVDTPFINQ